MKILLLSLMLVFISGLNNLNAQKLEKVWETSEGLKTPESVLFDETNDLMYVSNINGDATTKDGSGFISILNADGTVKELKWIENLNAPKGMALSGENLYVSDIDQLVEINVKSGEISNTYNAANAEFLNDVAASQNGRIFVSDSRGKKIYVLDDGKLSVWMEGAPLDSPNGLFIENGQLYIGDKNIYVADIKSKEIKQFAADAGGVDGLEKNKKGEFIFSNWPGRIFIHRNGKNIKLIDSTEEKINTADLDYSFKHDLILVPTFFDNRVVAYKLVD